MVGIVRCCFDVLWTATSHNLDQCFSYIWLLTHTEIHRLVPACVWEQLLNSEGAIRHFGFFYSIVVAQCLIPSLHILNVREMMCLFYLSSYDTHIANVSDISHNWMLYFLYHNCITVIDFITLHVFSYILCTALENIVVRRYINQ